MPSVISVIQHFLKEVIIYFFHFYGCVWMYSKKENSYPFSLSFYFTHKTHTKPKKNHHSHPHSVSPTEWENQCQEWPQESLLIIL